MPRVFISNFSSAYIMHCNSSPLCLGFLHSASLSQHPGSCCASPNCFCNAQSHQSALPTNICTKLRICDVSFQARSKSLNGGRETCEECKSLKFHGYLRDLQTLPNELVRSVKYLERLFISFHQSCRKHSNSCFLTSKGFSFLFHWFQMILMESSHRKRFWLLNGFDLPCRRVFLVRLHQRKRR